ncbi:AlpA family transcriptional regulator [Pseudomonas sp. A-1]|uniref:helix-turn-helix transcriptional regulator n=1 Tax=Pseudomonas sp. A-1 TaxID=1821274 RepID=UPI0010A6B1D7|nr:AlpA family transcriptional regulator [Pseudomonas sp. A-1]THG82987.1 AlpA family transcriptional regulator [Pseudomonas sp. A-1]
MKFMRLNDVKAATGLARSTIYKYVKQGSFPMPVSLGGRSVAWVESEVVAWIAARIRERDLQLI